MESFYNDKNFQRGILQERLDRLQEETIKIAAFIDDIDKKIAAERKEAEWGNENFWNFATINGQEVGIGKVNRDNHFFVNNIEGYEWFVDDSDDSTNSTSIGLRPSQED